MNRISVLVAASVLSGLSIPASATIVGFTPDALFGTKGYTVTLLDGSTYTFSAIPVNSGDSLYRAAALATTGSATAYGGGFIGGADYTSYSAGSATPANNFGGDFISAATARPIDYSLADTFVALRFGTGSSVYYGYAEVAGSTLVSFAYNDVAGGSITTGQAITGAFPSAVPEPAAWATMMVGLGAIGFVLRRRAKTRTAITLA